MTPSGRQTLPPTADDVVVGRLTDTIASLRWFGHTSASATIGAVGRDTILLIDGDELEPVDVDARGVDRLATADLRDGRVVVMMTGDGLTGFVARTGRRHPFRVPAAEARPTCLCVVPSNDAVELVWGDERGRIHALTIDDVGATSAPRRRQVHRKAVSQLVPTRGTGGGHVFVSSSDDRQVMVLGPDLAAIEDPLPAAGWVEDVCPVSCSDGPPAIAIVDRVGLSVFRNGGLVRRVQGKAAAPLVTRRFDALSAGVASAEVAFLAEDRVVLWSLADESLRSWPVVADRPVGASLLDGPTTSGRMLYGAGRRLWWCGPEDLPTAIDVALPAPIASWAGRPEYGDALLLLADHSIWSVRC